MRVSRRIALAALVALLAFAPARADEAVAPFTLAIVRLDGILTPFATWNGRAWENTWPTPEKEVDTPITIEETPKRWWSKSGPALAWQVWRPDGSTVETRVTAPAWYPAHCQQALGLRTTLPVRQAPPVRVQPYPKFGVAASRAIDLRPIERVDPASPTGVALIRAIRDDTNAEEARLVKQHQLGGWIHPYRDSERNDVPLRLEALYRAPAGGGRFNYYFEAVKQYPIRGREEEERAPAPGAKPVKVATCEVVTAVSGWFTSEPDAKTLKPHAFYVRPTSCDYESVDVMLPFGYLGTGDRRLWIAQFSGWGREHYVLLDPEAMGPSPEPVWAVPGGFCQTGRD